MKIKTQRYIKELQYLKQKAEGNKHYTIKEYIFCITLGYEYQEINIYRFVRVTNEMVLSWNRCCFQTPLKFNEKT